MKKTLILLAATAGLSLAGCAKHDADSTADTALTNDDVNGGDVVTNDTDLGANAVPADETNGLDADNATTPAAGNAL